MSELIIPQYLKPKNFEEVLKKLSNGKQHGNEYIGDCPCKGHKTPSGHLSLTDAGVKALVKCFPEGGHTYEQICEAWGFSTLNYAKDKPLKDRGNWRTTAYYVIDRQEKLGEKQFIVRRKDNEQFVYGIGTLKPILFNLPAVREAIKTGKPVLIPEGEGKATVLNKLGYTATTNPFGAGKWEASYTTALTGADVVILPDYDSIGLKFADTKARALDGSAKRIRLVHLPGIEMVAIKIADIDFDNQWIKVMGKGGKERVVGVCRRTQKALLQYLMRRHDDYPELWVTEERCPMKYEGVRMVFTRMKIRLPCSKYNRS